jgi:hypothetical protein
MQKVTEIFGQYGEGNFKEITDFVETIPSADLPEAVDKLQALQTQNPTVVGHELLLRFLQRWSENDVHSVADRISKMLPGDERQDAVAALAKTWARQNFAEAAAWVEQLPGSAERQSAQEGMAAETAFTNPLESLKLACTLPSSSTRDDIIARATATWAASAPENAAAWAKQISDETLRQQIISSVAITWGESNPVVARDLAVNSLPSGPVQDRTIVRIVQRWMMTDAPSAAAWVNRFPEGTLRQAALGALEEYAKRN